MKTHPPETESLRAEFDPADAEIATAAINAAMRLAAGQPDRTMLVELQQALRGHIALLLPLARKSARAPRHGSVEANRLTARFDSIEKQTRRDLPTGPLSANVQVQQLAHDCQWLLARCGDGGS
ncbi:DUF6415 family natural product biosynthesis protein [Streptomyces sp. NPDC050161]|uniref:DUF6415 family natural product biosynthesis protein n=1 Tax=Streptomyces sp. NPDC050161 TaxID=3365604 RepID=UPI003790C3E1